VNNISIDKINSILQPSLDLIDNMKDELINLTIEITETIAPTFMEFQRGELIFRKFIEMGYIVKRDEVGNIIASSDLNKLDDSIIVSAHLDTVFPDDITVKVTRKGDILHGPGVGDDSRGLAVLLTLARFLMPLSKKFPIVYVATVGEEGMGDLRGVKHLFNKINADNLLSCRVFITIDGSGSSRIITGATGSKRYRVLYFGPGGHSYGAFGTVNPIYAMSKFLVEFANITVSKSPKTTFSAGLINGGTSINAIPEKVWVDIDLRSENEQKLIELQNKVFGLIDSSIYIENSKGTGTISYEIKELGDRPCGLLDSNSELYELIKSVNTFFDIETDFMYSSTDANFPLSIGIPAFAIGGIEISGRAHTVDEWIDAGESSLLIIKRNLMLIGALSLQD